MFDPNAAPTTLNEKQNSLMFDPNAPTTLIEKQTWFANAIVKPQFKSHDAEKYILPNVRMSAEERLEIYHQQYWWRLQRCLTENFPFLTRLFGYFQFYEKIATPFLAQHPPTHWNLNRLGQGLPQYLDENYKDIDRELVCAATRIDWACQSSFSCEKKAPFRASTEAHLKVKLALQPHIHLFEFSADLFSFREQFLTKDVDHWNTNPFPPLNVKPSYFVLYKSLQNVVEWKELSKGEYFLLSLFKGGISIHDACQLLEESDELYTVAEEYISLWFYEWASREWLSE